MKKLVLNMVFLSSVSMYASDTTLNRLFDKHYQALEEKKAREVALRAPRKKIEPIEVKTASLHDKAKGFRLRVEEFGSTVVAVSPPSTRTIDELVAASALLNTTDWRTYESRNAQVATPATPTLSPQRLIRDASMMFAMDLDA